MPVIVSRLCSNLLNRYRAHLVYPFEAMIVTLAVGGMMQMESNLEMVGRTALAIEDHDTLALLPKVAGIQLAKVAQKCCRQLQTLTQSENRL